MRYLNLVSTFLMLLLSTAGLRAGDAESLNLIPFPQKAQQLEGLIRLNEESKIVVDDPRLTPIAKVLSQRILLQTGLELAIASGVAEANDIFLMLEEGLAPEGYSVVVDDRVKLSGGDYRAVCWAAATLSQLLHDGANAALPRVRIEDRPDYEFRSVLLDLARRWHPIDTVEQTIDLLSLYKIKYLHLHLSDTQYCVYTSKVLPKMASRRAYSWEEMKQLVQFADDRGVTIIPEIDVPGHCSSWVPKMPELFGTTDPDTGEAKPLGIVNMANENAYEALDQLIGELSEVFASSPYIHIGTDETGAGGLVKLPEYQPYCQKHGLQQAAQGQAHELFLHFIERMSRIVKKHGKQPIAWNDFGGASTPNTQVPKDVLMTVWTGSPVTMAKRGYKIVNCCWLPLYMVPPQQKAPEAERIYDWNVRLFDNWHFEKPIVISPDTPVEGAQLCFWEQRYNEVMPILRPRLPAFSERLWNEKAGRTLEDFQLRRNHTDEVARKTILPVQLHAQGLINPGELEFENQLQVELGSQIPGTIRYTLSNQWERFPDEESNRYTDPITVDATTTVSARLYSKSGRQLGGITQQRYRKIIPAYDYRILGPTPNAGWKQMPDVRSLKVLRTGVTGLMDDDRADQINRSMFAKLPTEAHVDVRVPGVYNVKTLELKGQLRVPKTGELEFKMRTGQGMTVLDVGGVQVVEAIHAGRESVTRGKVVAGDYPFTIKHFHKQITNELNLWVKLPGEDEFQPFENLVLPISERVEVNKLSQLPEETVFQDPIKAAYKNLATDKPVMSSGGWQGDWRPANAVDGVPDNSSGWHADPYPQSLQVDLGGQHSVSRIKLYPYYDGHRYYQYTIEVSGDGHQWKQVVDMTKNVQPSSKQGDEHNFPAAQARYVRVNMLTNSVNSGVHLNELMVFEDTE